MTDKCKGCGAGRGCIGYDPCSCCGKCMRCGEAHGHVAAPFVYPQPIAPVYPVPTIPYPISVEPTWVIPNQPWPWDRRTYCSTTTAGIPVIEYVVNNTTGCAGLQ